MYKFFRQGLAVLSVISSSATASAQTVLPKGTPDTSFGINGTATYMMPSAAFTVNDDSSIVVVGQYNSTNPSDKIALTHFSKDGQLLRTDSFAIGNFKKLRATDIVTGMGSIYVTSYGEDQNGVPHALLTNYYPDNNSKAGYFNNITFNSISYVDLGACLENDFSASVEATSDVSVAYKNTNGDVLIKKRLFNGDAIPSYQVTLPGDSVNLHSMTALKYGQLLVSGDMVANGTHQGYVYTIDNLGNISTNLHTDATWQNVEDAQQDNNGRIIWTATRDYTSGVAVFSANDTSNQTLANPLIINNGGNQTPHKAAGNTAAKFALDAQNNGVIALNAGDSVHFAFFKKDITLDTGVSKELSAPDHVNSIAAQNGDFVYCINNTKNGSYQNSHLSRILGKPKNSTVTHISSLSTLQDNSVSIYPNPAQKAFIIEDKEAGDQERHVEIFDASGRKVLDRQAGFKQNQTTMETDFPSGMYFIKMESKNGSKIERLVITQ